MLKEQRKKLVTDAQALIGREVLTKEDLEKFDKMMADADALKADIGRLEQAEAAPADIRNAPPESKPRESRGRAERKSSTSNSLPDELISVSRLTGHCFRYVLKNPTPRSGC